MFSTFNFVFTLISAGIPWDVNEYIFSIFYSNFKGLFRMNAGFFVQFWAHPGPVQPPYDLGLLKNTGKYQEKALSQAPYERKVLIDPRYLIQTTDIST